MSETHNSHQARDVISSEEPKLLDLERWKIQLYSFEHASRILQLCASARHHGVFSSEQIAHGNGSVAETIRRVQSALRLLRLPRPKQDFMFQMVLEEATQNGTRMRDEKGKPVEGEYQKAWVHHGVIDPSEELEKFPDPQYMVMVENDGRSFDPRNDPNPLHIDNLEEGNGRGFLLMGNYMAAGENNLEGELGYFPLSPLTAGEDDTPFLTRQVAMSFSLWPLSSEAAREFFAEWLKKNPPTIHITKPAGGAK